MRPARFALVLALALPGGGCAVLPRIVPMDASGMDPALDMFSTAFHDQVRETRATVAGLPAATVRHFRTSWHRLMVGP